VVQPSSSLLTNQSTSATDLGYINGQELPQQNIHHAKHNNIFLREEILQFLMAPTVKTHLCVLERKVWMIKKLWKHLNSASKNTPETDIFPHGTKSLLTSVIIP
jgi:hypothetical protein